MFGETTNNSPTLITGIFCEPFSAASAIAGLLRSGFADDDIHAVGVLEGKAPAAGDYLLAIGLPTNVAAFYSECFEDGAVLLMVRADRACGKKRKKNAIELIKHHGGVCARAIMDCSHRTDLPPARNGESNRLGGGL